MGDDSSLGRANGKVEQMKERAALLSGVNDGKAWFATLRAMETEVHHRPAIEWHDEQADDLDRFGKGFPGYGRQIGESAAHAGRAQRPLLWPHPLKERLRDAWPALSPPGALRHALFARTGRLSLASEPPDIADLFQ